MESLRGDSNKQADAINKRCDIRDSLMDDAWFADEGSRMQCVIRVTPAAFLALGFARGNDVRISVLAETRPGIARVLALGARIPLAWPPRPFLASSSLWRAVEAGPHDRRNALAN